MKPPINTLTREHVERFRAHENSSPNMLNLYQQLATQSAFYPGAGTPLGMAYVALKLNGESGEFAEHVGKAMRDDGLIDTLRHYPATEDHRTAEWTLTASEMTPARHALLVKEVGDVLWYLSAACNELGISLSDAAVANLEKLADRAERGALQGSGDDR